MAEPSPFPLSTRRPAPTPTLSTVAHRVLVGTASGSAVTGGRSAKGRVRPGFRPAVTGLPLAPASAPRVAATALPSPVTMRDVRTFPVFSQAGAVAARAIVAQATYLSASQRTRALESIFSRTVLRSSR